MRTWKTHRTDGIALCVLRGVLIAIAATAAAVVIFALVISLFQISDGAIRTVNQLIKLAAVWAGVHFAVRRGDDRAVLCGAIIGFIYMGAGVLVYAALTAQRLTATAYAADLLMGIAAGGLIGMIRSKG